MSGILFYIIAGSFLAGTLFASFHFVDAKSFLLAGNVSFGAFVFIFASVRKEDRSIAMICSVCAILAFAIGGLRLYSFGKSTHAFDRFIGQEIAVEGIVCSEPERKELSLRFKFCSKDVGNKIMVTADRYPEYSYGDKLKVLGTMKLPENFETYEGGPTFDYISYLKKDGVRYVVSRPKIEKISSNEGSLITATLIKIKSAFMDNIDRSMTEPHSSLVVGILLGEKGALPQDLSDSFRRTGLTHILVLSGSNVTLVAENMLKAFSLLPRVLGLSFGAVSIVLFAIMTGASATTIRASLMALVVVLARGVGRRYDVARALSLAAVLMVIHNPLILAFDIGFQLSFLATLALILVSPIVSDKLGFITEKFQIKEIVSTNIATQAFTAPFILYSMGEISIISLLANLLVLPTVPWSMFLGFSSGLAGFVSPILSIPFSWVNTLLLSYGIEIVTVLGNMPFASVKTKAGVFTLALCYIIYTVALIFLWRKKNSPQPSAS